MGHHALLGDQKVILSHLVLKVGRHSDVKEIVLLVTDVAVYNLQVGTYRVKRRIEFKVRRPPRASVHVGLCLSITSAPFSFSDGSF